uniref:Uncharacterized protein n=1 Tax=Anguilla anguilla TaxID=7936 RepID=A0A0E9SQH9_ANGAN
MQCGCNKEFHQLAVLGLALLQDVLLVHHLCQSHIPPSPAEYRCGTLCAGQTSKNISLTLNRK